MIIRKWLFFLLIGGYSGQRKVNKLIERVAECKSNWQYFVLPQSTKGIVLMQTKLNCGYVHVHANTIIITEIGDTIRIEGPCYTEKVQPLDSVLINPYKSDGSSAIGDLKYDCIVKKTSFGLISKIK